MNKMSKSEVYSWRITPALKAEIEAAARQEKTTVALLLERMARDWLEAHMADDDEEQRRLRKQLFKAIEEISSAKIPGPHIGSATNKRVREVMGERLMSKYREAQRRAPRRSD
jgi:hypothetical protein